MANGNGSNGSNGHGGIGVKVGEALEKVDEKVRGSQAWTAIFRPGSVFRRGYTDSPRNRSYVIMNNVLYHLHPVKVKRHTVKVSLHALPRRAARSSCSSCSPSPASS